MGKPRRAREIAADLRGLIACGLLAPGEQLPTGAELRRRYGVAKATVHTAIKTLRDEGLVDTRQGVGVYVRDRVPPVRLVRRPVIASQPPHPGGDSLLQSFTAADVERWLAEVTTKVSIASADALVAEELGIDVGDEVLIRSRTMADNGVIVALVTSYFPRAITRDTVIESVDTGDGGVFARLKDLGHVTERHVELVSSGFVTDDESTRMAIDSSPPPVLRIKRQTVGPGARVLGCIHITALADRFELLYEIPAE